MDVLVWLLGSLAALGGWAAVCGWQRVALAERRAVRAEVVSSAKGRVLRALADLLAGR